MARRRSGKESANVWVNVYGIRTLAYRIRMSQPQPLTLTAYMEYWFIHFRIILEWTTSLDTSSRTLFVREGGCPRQGRMSTSRADVHVTSNVELRQIVIERRVT